MLITKDVAQELASANECDGYTVVERKMIDHSRWSLRYRIVVEKDGRFYVFYCSHEKTKDQDESPCKKEPDRIEFKEVHKKEIVTAIYE